MKSRLLGFGLMLLMTVSTACASDILLNGNFADGKTHWHGAGDSPGAQGLLVITLKPEKWTVVTQSFNAKAGALQLSITYSLSPDCTLGKSNKLVAPLTPTDLGEACGVDCGFFNVTFEKREIFTALVVGNGFLFTECPVYHRRYNPSPDSDKSTTFTGQLSAWNGGFDDAHLCLCFPPGQGTVTLTNVTLTPPGQ